MNRIHFRFFTIFSLYSATLLVWLPVCPMNDVVHAEDGVEITQKDIDNFKAGTLSEERFTQLKPVAQKYVSIIKYAGYQDYKEVSPEKLTEYGDQLVTEFKNIASKNAASVIYKDEDIRITQKDLDDFRWRRLTETRFNEILPTFSDLLENESYDWFYIGNMTYQEYKNIDSTDQYGRAYQIRNQINNANHVIKQKTDQLSRRTLFKTVPRKHPKHQERLKANAAQTTSSSTALSSPQNSTASQNTIHQEDGVEITQDDLTAFKTGNLTKQRFQELKPVAQKYIPDLAYVDYDMYKSQSSTDLIQYGDLLVAEFKKTARSARKNIVYKDKKVTIRQEDINALKNGTITQKRFEQLAPHLAEYEPELDGMLHEDYLDLVQQEPQKGLELITTIEETFKDRAQEELAIQETDESFKQSLAYKITQADIDAFEHNELTQQRFDELAQLLKDDGMDVPITYEQYLKSGSLWRLGLSFATATYYKGKQGLAEELPWGALWWKRSEMTKMLVMGLNMQGASLSMPEQRTNTLQALWILTCATTKAFTEFTVDGIATLFSGKNHFAERDKLRKEKEAQEKAELDAEAELEREADAILAEYPDEEIDKLIEKLESQDTVSTIDLEKKQKIKEQNYMIAGGLMPEQIDWDYANFHADIGKNMPYPIALYNKDLVYGAGFATKACVAYWTISQLSKYRADYIYKDILAHTDEFLTLLKELDQSIKNPEKPTHKRSWKQYTRDKISGKNNDSTQLYNLKQYINAHHGYIGYNPFKFPMLGHLAISLFSKVGIAKAYDQLIITDDSYPESRCAYYKDETGRYRKLPGDYAPISVTQAIQSLSPSGLFTTAVDKIPPYIRSSISVPLSKKEALVKIEHYTPENIRAFLKSKTMAYIGLFATALFEITFMNDLYHIRWHKWVLTHQEYLIDLLERYQQARMLPEDNEIRTQLEEELLLCIKEGNALSSLNRVTLWHGIIKSAFNKVTFLCAAPLIGYALWHNKEPIAKLSMAVTKQLSEYAYIGAQMLPIVAQHIPAAIQHIAENPRETAQSLIEIPIVLTRTAVEITFEAAKAVAKGIAASTIITGATIIHSQKVQKIVHNKKVRRYAERALQLAIAGFNRTQQVLVIARTCTNYITNKVRFKRRGY